MKIAGYDIIEQLSESEKSRVYLGRQAEGEGLAILKTSLPGTAARLSEALLRNEYETTRGW